MYGWSFTNQVQLEHHQGGASSRGSRAMMVSLVDSRRLISPMGTRVTLSVRYLPGTRQGGSARQLTPLAATRC